jgi:3-oxoadipate enol-lactonase
MPFFSLKDGTRMFYKGEGSGSPPLVMIHGAGDNSWVWNRQIPYFSKFYRVITPDLKGHGASDKPQGHYSMRVFAEEVNQLFDKLLGQEKFVLCGHAMGGFVTLTYATDPIFSKRLKGAILCDIEYRTKGNPALKAFVDACKKGMSPHSLPLGNLGKLGFNIKFQREHKDIVQKHYEESLKCPDHVMISFFESNFEEYDMTDKLSQISLPVLVITSDTDVVADPKQSNYVKEHIKNSQLVVLKPAIGHFTQLESPDDFNKAVKSFMDKIK